MNDVEQTHKVKIVLPPTLDELIAYIRIFCGIGQRRKIEANTYLERDLEITGDDGVDLLEAIETKFNIRFADDHRSIRDAFNLDIDQYLFHPEGLGAFAQENVTRLKVRDIHSAILKKWKTA